MAHLENRFVGMSGVRQFVDVTSLGMNLTLPGSEHRLLSAAALAETPEVRRGRARDWRKRSGYKGIKMQERA